MKGFYFLAYFMHDMLFTSLRKNNVSNENKKDPDLAFFDILIIRFSSTKNNEYIYGLMT